MVGAATRESIAPNVSVYAGGFGASPLITTEHDPIQVRAFYVRTVRRPSRWRWSTRKAYFAAYQEWPDYGSPACARRRRSRSPLPTTVGDGPGRHHRPGHAHACGRDSRGSGAARCRCPTKLVHDQTVSAIAEAAQNARAAHLETGTYDAPWLDNTTPNQTGIVTRAGAQDGQGPGTARRQPDRARRSPACQFRARRHRRRRRREDAERRLLQATAQRTRRALRRD